MGALANFHFLRPWALALLLPAAALWWMTHARSDTTSRWRAVIAPELLPLLTVSGSAKGRVSPAAMLAVAWALATLAVAGPTWVREPSPFAATQPPIMVVLKVAPSMQATDVAPTRAERARQKVSDLLALREGAAAGLVAYGGSAHLVLPPTPDRAVVTSMAKALTPDVMPTEGDALAQAVSLAAQTLASGGQSGSILVLADTLAPGQTDLLRAAVRPGGPPVTLLAMLPPVQVPRDAPLKDAADALGAALVPLTIDDADVGRISLQSDSAHAATAPQGTERWAEAGYWLTPLLAVLVAAWFRRGWVLAS